jgi:hypothetical protein
MEEEVADQDTAANGAKRSWKEPGEGTKENVRRLLLAFLDIYILMSKTQAQMEKLKMQDVGGEDSEHRERRGNPYHNLGSLSIQVSSQRLKGF